MKMTTGNGFNITTYEFKNVDEYIEFLDKTEKYMVSKEVGNLLKELNIKVKGEEN